MLFNKSTIFLKSDIEYHLKSSLITSGVRQNLYLFSKKILGQ
jgi:hypothetical protein